MKSLNKMPEVTVGIVVFNTPIAIFKETVRSLYASSEPVVVFCLCNSNDKSYQESVKKICFEFGANCISYQPNQGFSAGHNRIWNTILTEWYVCCNPDIKIHPATIQRLIEFSKSTPATALVMPKILNEDGSVQPVARQHPTMTRWLKRQIWRLFPSLIRPYERNFNYLKTQPVEFVTGCFFMVRKSLMIKLNGFDENFFLYAEDADISRRAERFGTNWYVHDAIVTHRWSAEWRRSLRAVTRNMLALLRYWRKHGFLI